jgi:hypothetical protein
VFDPRSIKMPSIQTWAKVSMKLMQTALRELIECGKSEGRDERIEKLGINMDSCLQFMELIERTGTILAWQELDPNDLKAAAEVVRKGRNSRLAALAISLRKKWEIASRPSKKSKPAKR